MKEVDVLIIIESKARELESACLLKIELERRGYISNIVSMYPNKEELPFVYKAKVVLSPWAYNDNDMKLLSCFYINRDTKIVNMHHEEYSGNDDVCVPKGTARDVYHLSWGDEFTNKLLQVGCDRKKICQSGNIRLDFFKDRFSYLNKTKQELASEFAIDESKKWIMFIANGYQAADEKDLETISARMDKNVQKKADASKKSRKYFFEYVENYLENNDDVVFIYRPHPSFAYIDLKKEEVQRLVKKYPKNFYCIFEYSIKEWILNCDCAISFHSTAGIECFAAKKKFCLFRPVDFDKSLDYPFYHDYDNVIYNYDEFEREMKLDSYGDVDYFDNCMTKYFQYDDNIYSYEMICDFIESIINKYQKNKPKTINIIYIFTKRIIKNLIIAINRIGIVDKVLGKKDARFQHLRASAVDDATKQEILDVESLIKKGF